MKARMGLVICSLLCPLLWVAQLQGEELRPLAPEDLWDERCILEIVPSPDGRTAAFLLTSLDREKKEPRSHIWEVDLAGGIPPRQLTRGLGGDSEPRYSPDGRWLAFVSDRAGKAGVYLLPRAGGEAQVPFALDSEVSSLAWSPDSRRLCFLARPPAPAPETDVRVITRLLYRIDGEGYQEVPEQQLWEADVATGTVRQLTEGLFSLADPVYAPDGGRIYFAVNLSPDPDREANTDLCAVPSGGGPFVRITATPESETRPRPSPDGRRLAYLRSRRANDWYAMDDLWCCAADGSGARDLSGSRDRNVAGEGYWAENVCAPRWSADGRSVYILLQEGPDVGLYRCPASGEEPPCAFFAPSGSMIEHPHFLEGDRVLLHGMQSATEGTEVYLSRLDGEGRREGSLMAPQGTDRSGYLAASEASSTGPPATAPAAAVSRPAAQRLTFFQQERLRGRRVAEPQRLDVRSADGAPVDAWLLQPRGLPPGGRAPLILTIHGGPIWFYGSAFDFEMQLWAGRGYAVLYANPRGSSGYGQAFADAIKTDWGTLDYQDLMAAVDAALATGTVDPRRLGVTGLSYGGIMTNWIVGHTGRFAAAVSEEGLCNYESSYGTDDCQIDWESEYGLPWENRELYRARSPLTYATNVTTPLLIIHGEEDWRTNVEQAEQWFITLQRLGKEVVFLRYPRESHVWRESGEPAHRLDRLRRVLAWWEKYLRPEAGEEPGLPGAASESAHLPERPEPPK